MARGPGRYHRKGITLTELADMFPDDAAAEAWFAKQRWPLDKPWCPHCWSMRVQTGASHPSMPYRCRDCRKRFSVRTGTVMERSKLGYRIWAFALYLMTTGIKGTSSMKLSRDLGVTQKTAWHLAHRIREMWSRDHAPFEGPVEADETHVGGRLQRHSGRHRGIRGRGSVGKTAVAGVLDRPTRRVVATVVPDKKTSTLLPFVMGHIEPNAQVYTDEWWAYRSLPHHGVVRHGVGQWVDGQAHTNGLESFWSLLKRGFHGTFHHVSPKHLDRYVREFSGRFNWRDYDTIEQMQIMARQMTRARLPYEKLIEGGPAYPKLDQPRLSPPDG
ncbi:MAG: IS1595 family transposase [Chloroflexota bacterium]|nr:IS1595 family transposase [Chloroflexota bacterium]MDE2920132.1 IS1595 family transposase [Chloroflexota bacterium]